MQDQPSLRRAHQYKSTVALLDSKYARNFCTLCNELVIGAPFIWDECEHIYCNTCVVQVINGSLSFCNAVPMCPAPNCGKRLSVANAHTIHYELCQSLLSRYMTCYNLDLSQLRTTHLLIPGFIREMQLSTFVPNDIIGCVTRFYDSVHAYCAVIDCVTCHGRGYNVGQCNTCHGKGFVGYGNPNACRVCNGQRMQKKWMACSMCQSTGRCTVIRTVNIPIAVGSSNCRWITTQRKESQICTQCFGNGGEMQYAQCVACSNPKTAVRMTCTECVGRGLAKITCAMCQCGKQGTLQFRSLTQQQLQCGKCRTYFPLDQVEYWSGCQHVFCCQCSHDYVFDCITNRRLVPQCLMEHCGQKLTVDSLASFCVTGGHTYCAGLVHDLKEIIAKTRVANSVRCEVCQRMFCYNRKCARIMRQRMEGVVAGHVRVA